jgi:RimJ/RimL family protein N-acetyltransferase
MNNPHSGEYKIVHSEPADLDFIFSLFESAIHYQQRNGYEQWPQFSREMIKAEMQEHRNWKIVEGNVIVCTFSVHYSDPGIWKERNDDPAVYLHRIVINPQFKGRGIMNVVKQWAIAHAQENQKRFVRMDTWGTNVNLRNYYIRCGFNYLGQQQPEETDGQPAYYGGPVLSLFEIEAQLNP